ncbi:DUF2269 family protein [Bacillus piscicola]|uniref:DUF2269 family protein n=1 Tax=Bacillus piscicola TaxID=1632684 RepID=UPI001F0909DE|nr:DUF2269 family protein [Bacillus piscicola]
MTVYSLIILVHIIAAVCGLGATFALPVLMNKPKTVTQAQFAFTVNAGVEKLAKVGSITLLITGLMLGIMNPHLFTQGWYIISIIVFIAIQPVVIVVLPKKMAKQMKILETHDGTELPEAYKQIGKQLAPFHSMTHIAAVVLIILMVLKPF